MSSVMIILLTAMSIGLTISDDHDVGYWSGLLKKRSQLILVHILGYLGAIESRGAIIVSVQAGSIA